MTFKAPTIIPVLYGKNISWPDLKAAFLSLCTLDQDGRIVTLPHKKVLVQNGLLGAMGPYGRYIGVIDRFKEEGLLPLHFDFMRHSVDWPDSKNLSGNQSALSNSDFISPNSDFTSQSVLSDTLSAKPLSNSVRISCRDAIVLLLGGEKYVRFGELITLIEEIFDKANKPDASENEKKLARLAVALWRFSDRYPQIVKEVLNSFELEEVKAARMERRKYALEETVKSMHSYFVHCYGPEEGERLFLIRHQLKNYPDPYPVLESIGW